MYIFFQLFGTTELPFKDIPLLEVKLKDAKPEAFEMVLNYIYTDRIDPTKTVSYTHLFVKLSTMTSKYLTPPVPVGKGP